MTEGKVFAVTSGEYSDYGVICIFERLDDALQYVATYNKVSVDDQRYLFESANLPGGEWHHERNTPRYRELSKSLDYDAYQVETFDFYPVGVVPVLDAS